ncbi:methyltransferase domain-containing protein [Salininema proteolyticum]|uniref:Protein-L-isoaspartate O-methyltransferase n=1 Tax=Salininema proteolyticum TaxID=1607685 RepID=A0ABV8TTE3_9ACTN
MMDQHWKRMLSQLKDEGYLLSTRWEAAFSSVDRAVFLPPRIDGVEKTHRFEEWQEAAYTLQPIVTKRATNGTPISSSSDPRVMLDMLESLGLEPGMRVLELGTGTGYNTALLCAVAGTENVTSIDIDSDVTLSARINLSRCGYPAVAVTRDGKNGYATRAPYDRLIVTYAVDRLEPAWLQQVADGGLIVAPWENDLGSQVVAQFRVQGGQATGRATAECAFMFDRAEHESTRVQSAGAYSTTTAFSPEYFREYASVDLWIIDQIPGISLYPHDDVYMFTRGSDVALLGLEAGEDDQYPVMGDGHPGFWNEIEAAYSSWFEAGRPFYEDYRLHSDPSGAITADVTAAGPEASSDG